MEDHFNKYLCSNNQMDYDEINWAYSNYSEAQAIFEYLFDTYGEDPNECIADLDIEFPLNNINGLTHPCARLIFNQLEDGIFVNDILHPEIVIPSESLDLNFSELILNLFNESNTFLYSIENGTPTIPFANAETNAVIVSTNPPKFNINTIIENNYLNSATKLSIARTMIHELVHGYLLARGQDLDFTIAMSQYANQNDVDTEDLNEFHHEFMKGYIQGMAYSLRQWDINSNLGVDLGWDYYYSMAFSGQFETDTNGNIVSTSDTFLALVPNSSERQSIVDIILNEQNGNNYALGTPCN